MGDQIRGKSPAEMGFSMDLSEESDHGPPVITRFNHIGQSQTIGFTLIFPRVLELFRFAQSQRASHDGAPFTPPNKYPCQYTSEGGDAHPL